MNSLKLIYHQFLLSNKSKTIRSKYQILITHNISKSSFVSKYDHLIRKRIGPTVGHIQLGFEVGLRNYNNSPQELSREREWDPTQYLQNQSKTVFLPTLQQELTLKKTLKPPPRKNASKYKNYMKNFEIDGFDGYHRYPAYTDKIVRSKNYNEISGIHKYEKDGDKSINQLKWELNLNNYQNSKRKTTTEQQDI